MPNSIRTPKQGLTESSRRIAQAVDNEGWQECRLSMKGISTEDKIKVLTRYWAANALDRFRTNSEEDVRIRVDNYIKALCRGGQLEAGTTIDNLLDGSIKDRIRK